MITAHLTDIEIQLYVTEPELISGQLAAHVQNCALCRSSVDNYVLLIKGIHDSAKPTFEFDLSALVIEQLPGPKSAFPWLVVLIPLLSVALVAVSAVFFWSALIQVITGMSGILFTITAAGAVVIIIFHGIEMLKDHQKRMKTLLTQKTLQL